MSDEQPAIGRVTVFERARPAFPELARDPAETRRIAERRVGSI